MSGAVVRWLLPLCPGLVGDREPIPQMALALLVDLGGAWVPSPASAAASMASSAVPEVVAVDGGSAADERADARAAAEACSFAAAMGTRSQSPHATGSSQGRGQDHRVVDLLVAQAQRCSEPNTSSAQLLDVALQIAQLAEADD